MNISDLISNNQYAPNGYPIKQFIQLGSGLSMQVTGCEVHPNGWVNLKVQRYNRVRESLDTADLMVTESGGYLPNGAICINDVICVLNEDGSAQVTLKGSEHDAKVDLSTALEYKKQLMRVKTRGGYWYTVRDVFEDTRRGIFMLQLGQVGAECKLKMKHYYNDGLEFSEAGYNKRFSVHDIVEVQIA